MTDPAAERLDVLRTVSAPGDHLPALLDELHRASEPDVAFLVSCLRIAPYGLIGHPDFGSVGTSLQRKGSSMLSLTDTATTAVKAIIDGTPDAAGGGLRIGSGLDDNSGFEVSIVATPAPGDSTVESDGAKVFLEAAAAAALDDRALDAQVGDNGTVTFAIVPQVT